MESIHVNFLKEIFKNMALMDDNFKRFFCYIPLVIFGCSTNAPARISVLQTYTYFGQSRKQGAYLCTILIAELNIKPFLIFVVM